jgi:hypothetical protein
MSQCINIEKCDPCDESLSGASSSDLEITSHPTNILLLNAATRNFNTSEACILISKIEPMQNNGSFDYIESKSSISSCSKKNSSKTSSYILSSSKSINDVSGEIDTQEIVEKTELEHIPTPIPTVSSPIVKLTKIIGKKQIFTSADIRSHNQNNHSSSIESSYSESSSIIHEYSDSSTISSMYTDESVIEDYSLGESLNGDYYRFYNIGDYDFEQEVYDTNKSKKYKSRQKNCNLL